MALSANTVWEVRTSGADTNGAGFVTGASGTDHSQQDAAQYSVTDAVTDGSSTITSATANFGTDVVGNILYITGGTGAITADRYQITVRNSATSITVDRATGLTTGTGATLKIGGAAASPGEIAGDVIGGNDVHIKGGTYTISSTSANVSGGRIAIADMNMLWQGYQTTRGDDGTAPVLQVAAAGVTSITVFTLTSGVTNGTYRNITVDGQLKVAIRGFSLSGCHTDLLTAMNCTNHGFRPSGLTINRRAVATGCTTVDGAIFDETSSVWCACVAHDNAVSGFYLANTACLEFCVADTNTSYGFLVGGAVAPAFMNCIAYANGNSGFRVSSAHKHGAQLTNCIAEANGGFGFGGAGSNYVGLFQCAAFNNTSGNIDSNLSGPQVGFVTGSASFFINAVGSNFALNTTAGAGAALRATGYPGAFPGGLTTGYLDIGAAQHQDAGGGTVVGITAQLV